MKKIMNNPTEIVEEMIEGMVNCYPSIIKRVENYDVLVRTTDYAGKVGLVSGGGSGHEPSHAGFVGKGMLTAAVCGPVFTSPAPDQIFEAIKESDSGKGVLLVIKNYSGDVMNFEMALELAELEGIEVDSIIVDDDIAVEDSLYTQGKRGVAGTVLVHKILGYYAEQGKSLLELKEIADKLVINIQTIGFALTGAVTPEGGKATFNLNEDEIEYGVGIHGEPGYRTENIKPSKEMAKELLEKLKASLKMDTTERFGILVNGMGGTPLMELYVFANDVCNIMREQGYTSSFKKVGNYMTSLDMEGASLTVIKFEDLEWENALEYKVETIAW